MRVDELTREQLRTLKQNFLIRLSDEGCFDELLDVGYDGPTWGNLENADELVPDDVIFREYEGYECSEDDF